MSDNDQWNALISAVVDQKIKANEVVKHSEAAIQVMRNHNPYLELSDHLSYNIVIKAVAIRVKQYAINRFNPLEKLASTIRNGGQMDLPEVALPAAFSIVRDDPDGQDPKNPLSLKKMHVTVPRNLLTEQEYLDQIDAYTNSGRALIKQAEKMQEEYDFKIANGIPFGVATNIVRMTG